MHKRALAVIHFPANGLRQLASKIGLSDELREPTLLYITANKKSVELLCEDVGSNKYLDCLWYAPCRKGEEPLCFPLRHLYKIKNTVTPHQNCKKMCALAPDLSERKVSAARARSDGKMHGQDNKSTL
jgi:hypothetical protein